MEIEERQEVLEKFLERWPESAVREMTLGDYVGVANKDTFTYWVETYTRPLGSIKGGFSSKFGIYRRRDAEKTSQNRQNDDEYTWLPKFGENREDAFKAVKAEIIHIIDFAGRGEFAKIDDLHLPDLFKWKVASLYSNERLVPIFKWDVLVKIAAAYGLKVTRRTKVSEIHQIFINNKPSNLDIYSYMEALYAEYGSEHRDEPGSPKAPKDPPPKRSQLRKSVQTKNVVPQVRTRAGSYIAEMKHNKLQMALQQRLIKQYGDAAVPLEENWVDLKVVLPDEIIFYEVKSASYASACIREALGQVLNYVFTDSDPRKKRIVVVGQYPPNESDKKFISYVQYHLKIEFNYEHIDLSP